MLLLRRQSSIVAGWLVGVVALCSVNTGVLGPRWVDRWAEHLLWFADAGCDVAIGSVGLQAAEVMVAQRKLRVFAGNLGNLVIRRLLLPGIHHIRRKCKALAAATIPSISEPLTIDGFGFDIEMLVPARRAGLGVCEIPIRWSHRPGVSQGLRTYAGVLGDVLRLRRRFGRVEPSDVNVLDGLRGLDSTE